MLTNLEVEDVVGAYSFAPVLVELLDIHSDRESLQFLRAQVQTS